MTIVALMPMKAHSERVKGKNFRDLLGRPLFGWMLETLLAVPAIDRVVINTDARDLLSSHGLREHPRVLVRDRRAEICGDFVSMNRVLEDDIANVPADTYLMTHTTNPLISSGTVIRALDLYQAGVREHGNDSLFSVNRLQTRLYRADGSAVNHDPANLVRTQDLEPWFEENSCLYVFSRDSFAATSARIGRKPILFETPRLESIDIDTQDDWNLVESLVRSRRQESE
jgi:CMP-N-acetylneuraminic acid synthetase